MASALSLALALAAIPPALAQVVPGPVRWVVDASTSNALTVRLGGGVVENTSLRLSLSSGVLSGQLDLEFTVQTRRLSLDLPATVSGHSTFALSVRGVDNDDNEDSDYSLSPEATVTPSSGALMEHARTASSLSLSLSGAVSAQLLSLTVVDDSLSAVAQTMLIVLPVALLLTAPSSVLVETPLTVQIFAVDAAANVDSGYVLPNTVTVSISMGTLSALSQASSTSLSLQLEGLSDGSTIVLTVSDGTLSGTVELLVFDLLQLDIDLDGDVDQTDALMMFRTLGFVVSTRNLIKDGTLSGFVVAGSPALLNEEVNIIVRIEALEASSNSVLDIDLDGDVDQTDALMMFRTLGFVVSTRNLIKDGTLSGFVVAGSPALLNEEVNIIVRIEQRAGL